MDHFKVLSSTNQPFGIFMKNTKENIIQKSFALFMTKGYNEVSVSHILKETGLSKGGFYHHFESKEALFESVVELFFTGVATDMSLQPDPEKSFSQNMDAFIALKQETFRMFAAHLGVEHSDLNIFMFIIQAIKHLPGVRQKVSIFMYNEKKQLSQIIEIALQRAEIRPVINSSRLADQIVCMFDGIEMQGLIMSESFETPARKKEMARQLFEWVKMD
jgi:TetR/AcrR family transcriptional regulator, transcriptional repressor for nem operon